MTKCAYCGEEGGTVYFELPDVKYHLRCSFYARYEHEYQKRGMQAAVMTDKVKRRIEKGIAKANRLQEKLKRRYRK